MPGLYGSFGNSLIPIFLGAPEIVLPRVNNISMFVLIFSYHLVIGGYFGEFGCGSGWTLYPPLSTSLISCCPVGVDVIIYGLCLAGISSSLTSINFSITIINMRSYSLTISSLPLYAAAILITAFLLLISLPFLTGALIMLLADVHYNTVFFDAIFGGDPVIYQHFFWFFGHPEVYILIIPGFGLISILMSVIATQIIFSCLSMLIAISCISILGLVV